MPASIFPAPRPTAAHRCAARLLTKGPITTAELSHRLDAPAHEVRQLTLYPWFRITGRGWELADEGWAEVAVYSGFGRPRGLVPVA